MHVPRLLLLLVAASVAAATAARLGRVSPMAHPGAAPTAARTPTPGVANTTKSFFTQPVDNFGFGNGTYQQRVFTNDSHWNSGCATGTPPGPLFFYTGNEGSVELYVDTCGLMWESASSFGAWLTWGEHRYYGESTVPGQPSSLAFLSADQALADYVRLVTATTRTMAAAAVAAHPSCGLTADDIPVIAFGGSYGGMLSSWMRMRYPAVVHGSIAASAPILAWSGPNGYSYNNETYWQVVTRDATAAGGSPAACADNVRAAFDAVLAAAGTPAGRDKLTSVFHTCDPVADAHDGLRLALLHYFAWDTMAMGSYAVPSNYMTAGGAVLPPFPLRKACGMLSTPNMAGDALLSAFNAAGAVFNNASGTATCYQLPTDLYDDGLLWDYQVCSQLMPEETFFTTDAVHDMFWARSVSGAAITQHCVDRFGIVPRGSWVRDTYGTAAQIAASATNILFSNGLLDPWSSGGVTTALSDALPVVVIPDGGHHADLFFSDPNDLPSVTAARETERQCISKWVAAFHTARGR